MYCLRSIILWLSGTLVCVVCGSAWLSAEETSDRLQDTRAVRFFETDVRPLLARSCFGCHSSRAEKLKGGLRLDNRAAILAGGDSGPSLVPGRPDASLLMEAVRYEGLEMPPDRRLSQDDVAKLEEWIRLGAPFPAGNVTRQGPAPETFAITDEDRKYWAYQPIRKPELPQVKDARWNQHPIDQLIYARLAKHNLKPNLPATPRQLVRRLYFDLIGLPPTSDQIDAFVEDPSQTAISGLIDHLLSLPQYGERWGRHWLDVVRFAQSNGYERDGEKPFVWRYRDYVIESLNVDKPYDRFVREQLAGDELSDATAESVAATAFYRLGVWDDEPDDARAAEYGGLDDMLSTIGQVFLGQTVGCARCHDHMFDPIAQRDYYELLSFLRNIKFYEKPQYALTSATYAPLAPPREVAKHVVKQRQQLAELEAVRDPADEAARKQIDKSIRKLRQDGGPFKEWTLAVREHGVTPKDTFLLVRGDAGTPREQVEPRFLSVLGNQRAQDPEAAYDMSCGLRTQLADWIASPENPLTARVIANRIWQYHFGRGIVRTPNDFGRAGLPPTHPRLLDWLAAELIENDWSIKHLHKVILRSQTWQMSSATPKDVVHEVDAGNHLFWRQNLRRLDAEAIRDSMLFVSGQLNPKMGGRGFFPKLSSEVLAGQSKPGWGWEVSSPDECNRRSVYIFTKRGVRDPLIESFDYVNTTSSLGVRPVTTVAPQALVLLNGNFVQRVAFSLAKRISQDVGDVPETSIHKLYRLALGRDASLEEIGFALGYLAGQERQFQRVQDIKTFKPDVPDTLKSDYRKRLDRDSYVIGPRNNWDYYPGKWVGGYEAVDALDEDRVPFMLWTRTALASGEVRGKLLLHDATRFGSLLINGKAEGEIFAGTEIRFDLRAQHLRVLQHTNDDLSEVTSIPIDLTATRWIDFKLVVSQSTASLFLGAGASSPTVVIELGRLNQPAYFGVAVSRGAVSFDDFVVLADGVRYHVSTDNADPISAELKAWQSLCVVLMNTNEFLYVD